MLLSRRYGGDMPSTTLLKEFKRCGVIEEQDGKLVALKRYYVPSQSDPAALLRAGSVINDLGSTLYHNLYQADAEKNLPLHFERRATNIQMSPESAEAFRQFVEHEGQAFLEKVDAWLSAHEQLQSATETAENKTQTLRLGVGTYLIANNFNDQISLAKKD